MAVLEVIVQELSGGAAEAKLIFWRKKVGDTVVQNENLADLETDKTVFDIPSPGAGILKEILKEAGTLVKAGDVIARIEQ